ncbi:legumain-like [Cimex lectularius]|uniref:legumain n=1 Tax=Cimex lectularius TaxID=79782 RepID=A0A8I6RAW3_CIMLE|nr:legumain-like [Cimex lectularius]
MKNSVLFLFFLFVVHLSLSHKIHNAFPNGGKAWALLVAGSSGFDNYRHQADICHAYQILHSNGIPDEQIVIMMVDDIAFNKKNPTPGKIINFPGGPNVYKGVPKDYTGSDVNPSVFLNVLKGNQTGVRGIGSEKVILSGPNDTIFVNFVDHGSPGYLSLQDKMLYADDLAYVLNDMASKQQFKKMLFYIEACYSGSMFDDILQDDLNILVMTAADPHESSFACFWDESIGTFLSDVFTSVWLNDSSREGSIEDINHQFEKVRTLTNTSHVEEYGDIDIGNTKLREFIGFHMERNLQEENISIAPNDVADNIDVPLIALSKKYDHEKNEKKKNLLKHKILLYSKMRKTIQTLVNRVLAATVIDWVQRIKIINSKSTLGTKNMPCYKRVIETFSSKCLSVTKNLYVRKHLYIFTNLCAAPNITTEAIVTGIHQSCKAPLTLKY